MSPDVAAATDRAIRPGDVRTHLDPSSGGCLDIHQPVRSGKPRRKLAGVLGKGQGKGSLPPPTPPPLASLSPSRAGTLCGQHLVSLSGPPDFRRLDFCLRRG